MIGPELRERISELIGDEVLTFERVHGGYSPADRWIVRTTETACFVKIATTEGTRRQLRQEIAAYDKIVGDFMPVRIASDDHELAPILILEDLSRYHWPPLWQCGQVDDVLAQISKIHESSADLPSYNELHGQSARNWSIVADDIEPLLGLGLISEKWLDQALPYLLEAESKCTTEGCALTHWDIRSDNICIRGSVVKLVDWNNACLGNPKLDTGFWLPSLAHEGGPAPEEILSDEPQIAAYVAGFFAARAGLPVIENAPQIRHVQRQQLETALSWAISALDLSPLD